MKNIKRFIFRGIGYSVFSLVTFLLFFYITFPMEAVEHRLNSEIAKATNGKMTLKAKKISLAGISGLRLKEINIFIEGEADQPVNRIALDEIEVKISLMKTISRAISGKNALLGPLGGLTVFVKQGSGSLWAAVDVQDENHSVITGNMEQLRLERLLPAFVNLPVPLQANLSGNLDLTIKKQWYSNGNGKLVLNLRNVSVGEGTIKTPLGPFALPVIDIGNLALTLNLEKGAIKVSDWKQTGNDLAYSNISGRIVLQKKMENSSLDLKLAFKLGTEFLEKNSKFNAMLTMSGMKQDNDGNYTISLGGRLSAPKVKGLSTLGI